MNKKTIAIVISLIALPLTIASLSATLAQRPKVGKKDGHLSPLIVKVKFPDGSTREGPGCVTGFFTNDTEARFAFPAIGNGDAAVTVWLDSVKTIKDTTDKEMLVVMKDGTERRLGIESWSNAVLLWNEDGGVERLSMSKIDRVDFLKPVRKDKDDHAMFDHWQYSPFTGEKLPEN